MFLWWTSLNWPKTNTATGQVITPLPIKKTIAVLLIHTLFIYINIDTVRAFKERNKLGRFSDEAQEQQAQFEKDNEGAASKIKVGDRCEVQLMDDDDSLARRGTVRFLGLTEFQPGTWVGIQYDEPLGKNDGSVKGVRYFTCPAKYGTFVRPIKVKVGDYPEQDDDLMMTDDELEEM